MHVTPSSRDQGLWWDVTFAAPSGSSLAVGVYNDAERNPFQAPGRPGFSVGGDGRGCNTVTGRFQIEEYSNSGGSLSFTATFEHHCEGGTPAVRGCVHYSR